MQSAVIRFPGSNCDRDMYVALRDVFGKEPKIIWHADSHIDDDIEFLAIPGGFSFGDYLRSGAMSARSPIMSEVKKFADKGRYVLGVCNGFQILTESLLLPGALMRNKNLNFICKTVELEVNKGSNFTNNIQKSSLNIPIAHHDGNYFISEDGLKSLEDNDQIMFKYSDNPNGSIANIAGIVNKNKNILGMMPHPERAYDKDLGNIDGSEIFKSILG